MRPKVHAKYGGRCAYCGDLLHIKCMQIDHIEPIRRGLMQLPEEIERLSQIDNLNPACASCNHRKRTHPLEEFRAEIAAQVDRLRRDSNQFKLAERFGLVMATGKPVVFYFEKQISDSI
jgi:5-methylcytosine-specific restriction endonuclease McrA